MQIGWDQQRLSITANGKVSGLDSAAQAAAVQATAAAEQAEALEQLRVLWHGYRIAVHISQVPSAAGVDTPADLERVQALLSKLR